MSEHERYERCSLCGRDCSFIAGMENVCLPCFDDLQSLGTAELTTRLVKAAREVNRLQAIVDKLPKTKDGVTVVPGMAIWFVGTFGSTPIKVHEFVVYSVSPVGADDGGRHTWPHSRSYSTREAAEAGGEP